MSTEGVSPRYLDLDTWPAAEQAKALYESQLAAVAAVGSALPVIAAAVEQAAARLRSGGRIIYVGSGTSARIGVQDGAELLPTFNWPSERVAFVIAGGEGALLRAVENAEDSREDGERLIDEMAAGPDDVVIGIAASGNTPFTVAALQRARARGCLTIGIANNPGSRLLMACACSVLIETGEEPVAGSTRLKAGTAQKVALNLISTGVMLQLGRVHKGMMVHMQPTNEKLRQRSRDMVATIAERSAADAAEALEAASGDIAVAVLLLSGLDITTAQAVLAGTGGNLRSALAEAKRV